MKVKELLKENKNVLYAWFADPMGNAKYVNSEGKVVNANRIPKSITDLDYLVSKIDVTNETGNSGTAHYTKYLKKRIEQAAKKSKNNKEFAKNLNNIFKTNIFTDAELF
jgi:hypothetical protein